MCVENRFELVSLNHDFNLFAYSQYFFRFFVFWVNLHHPLFALLIFCSKCLCHCYVMMIFLSYYLCIFHSWFFSAINRDYLKQRSHFSVSVRFAFKMWDFCYNIPRTKHSKRCRASYLPAAVVYLCLIFYSYLIKIFERLIRGKSSCMSTVVPVFIYKHKLKRYIK